MKIDYTELDAAILEQLAKGPVGFSWLCGSLYHISEPLAKPDHQASPKGWRVIDRRLQALRKRGLIEYSGGLWWRDAVTP